MSKMQNRLTQAEFFRMARHVETLRPEIEGGKYPGWKTVAEMVFMATGIKCDDQQVANAMKAAGIEPGWKRRNNGSTKAASAASDAMRGVLLLRETMRQFASAMGVQAPLLDDPVFDAIEGVTPASYRASQRELPIK